MGILGILLFSHSTSKYIDNTKYTKMNKSKFQTSKSNEPLAQSILSQNFDKSLREQQTPNGATLSYIIKSGTENPESKIGCYAADKESYSVFAGLLNPIIETYHNKQISSQHPKNTNIDGIDFSGIDSNYIVSTRVRVARNLTAFAFPSYISQKDRVEVERLIQQALSKLNNNLAGAYFPLGSISEKQRNQLIAEHYLFKKGDKFLESAGINRDWPDNRGIFISQDREFIVWVNEEDHIRIISMNKGGDFKAVFIKLFDAINQLSVNLDFAFDNSLGYLNSCPTNIGTAMRASVHIKLPRLSQKSDFNTTCSLLGLDVRGVDGEHSKSKEGIFDISNIIRFGVSEREILQTLVEGIRKLINLENSLS